MRPSIFRASPSFNLQGELTSGFAQTGELTVNLINAPNDSTLQCGCENINCPFCNLMLSIEGTDPTVLQ